MPTTHIVTQGQYVALIADMYGFHSYQTIWDDPANAQLKTLRQDPNVLLPGDRLIIPDKVSHSESIAGGARHKFIAKAVPLMLRVTLHDVETKAITGATCRFDIGTDSKTLVTDGQGKIQSAIPNTTQKGRLVVQSADDFDRDFEVGVGELDPIDTITGQIGRLNNLGYDAGLVQEPADDDDAAKMQFRSAVEEFQCNSKLKPIDGICGHQTQAKLKQAHGC